MIRYLADSSRCGVCCATPRGVADWADVISDHAIGSCQPQQVEFRRSARNLDEARHLPDLAERRVHRLFGLV